MRYEHFNTLLSLSALGFRHLMDGRKTLVRSDDGHHCHVSYPLMESPLRARRMTLFEAHTPQAKARILDMIPSSMTQGTCVRARVQY